MKRRTLRERYEEARLAYNAALRDEKRLERLLKKAKAKTLRLALKEESLGCRLGHE